MAISGKDFLKMSKEERNELFPPKALCPKCKKNPVPIDFDEKGNKIGYPIDGVFHCSDCYFEELGNGIEEHPICSPRMCRE